MRYVGAASLDQVVEAFRYDFVLREAKCIWPMPSQCPPRWKKYKERGVTAWLLPARFRVVGEKRPMVRISMGYAWALYGLTPQEVGEMTSLWGDRAWALNEVADAYVAGTWRPERHNSNRIGALRQVARRGRLRMGLPVAVREGDEGGIRLLEGHHRIVAALIEKRLPSETFILVGALPAAAGGGYLLGKNSAGLDYGKRA